LGGGEFHLGALAYQYDGSLTRDASGTAKLWTIHDDRFPIGTLFVSSPTDVGNVANLYPEIAVSARQLPMLAPCNSPDSLCGCGGLESIGR
jgi:hypothetical protein